MSSGLTSDLYHPDAAYIAWRSGQTAPTTFDLYTRQAPFEGAYLLVAGLAPAVEFIRDFRYADADLTYLAEVRGYPRPFLDYLRDLRFTGDVLAMPEGTVAFAHEPLLRLTAPFPEAIVLESALLQIVGLSTLIATKAARVVDAARGRAVAEFALRRAQNPDVVARASAIGGCVSTSYLDAAHRYGLQPSGTIPHALVQLYPGEADAFRAVAESLPRYTLVLDTYDTRRAVHTAIAVHRAVEPRTGHRLVGVRIDSGDLVADGRYVRAALDDAGLRDVRVLASGDLDEWRIAALLDAGAPYDGFGVGTSLGVGAGDATRGVPGGSLAAVYKAVWHESPANPALVKVAGEKGTWPGKKQVYRVGPYVADVIALDSEPPPPDATPLLRRVIADGVPLPDALPPLPEIVAAATANLSALPEPYHALSGAPAYPVRFSDGLLALREQAQEAAVGRVLSAEG
jgi:nicotinate phosphoribosyltransferase